MAGFSIAFSTRELWPFVARGGIGRVLHGTIRALAPEAEVTVITRESFRERYEQLLAAGEDPFPGVRFEFVHDPERLGAFSAFQHAWSALVFEKLRELYRDGGPDVVEFGDYLGEGFVTLQALRSGDPALRRTKAVVRLHTTLEIVDALNGRTEPDEEHRSIYTLERGSLAFADVLLSPGGDVLESYGRFYGEERVAPGEVVPHVIALEGAPALQPAPEGSSTRLLFIGRLERRKGVQELVEAALRLEREDFQLTLLGGDTDSAPGGGSMHEHLAELVGDDSRIAFHEGVPLARVMELIDEHHAVVIPSLWECWSAVARESLSRNRPVLATSRGGLPEVVRAGASGWLSEGSSPDQLARALETMLDSRDQIDALIASGAPAKHLHELMRPEVTVEHYRRLAAREPAGDVATGDEPVSAVIVCSAGAGPLQRTLDSLASQHRPVDEVVLVFDGVERVPFGFLPDAVDRIEVLDSGSGVAACRNHGAELARGELILMLDAGTELEPPLLERQLRAFRTAPEFAYVTTWSRDPDPAAVPFGNFANLVLEHDNAAVSPLIRRSVFERGHRFDSADGRCFSRSFYARLAEEGLFGSVVPERLLRATPFSARCGDNAAPPIGDVNSLVGT